MRSTLHSGITEFYVSSDRRTLETVFVDHYGGHLKMRFVRTEESFPDELVSTLIWKNVYTSTGGHFQDLPEENLYYLKGSLALFLMTDERLGEFADDQERRIDFPKLDAVDDEVDSAYASAAIRLSEEDMEDDNLWYSFIWETRETFFDLDCESQDDLKALIVDWYKEHCMPKQRFAIYRSVRPLIID